MQRVFETDMVATSTELRQTVLSIFLTAKVS